MKKIKLVIVITIISFSFYIMIFPVLRTLKVSTFSIERGIFLLVIIFLLFLPSIIYSIALMNAKKVEYIIVPGIFLLIAEYYFFHNYSVWIASDANAAIGLLVIPFYLMIVLAIAYIFTWILIRIKENMS